MKTVEEILREYVDIDDVNGSDAVSLLPLTIVDVMEEYTWDRMLWFCKHLNTYEGFEDYRFDLMLDDFNEKNQQDETNC